MPKGCGEKRRLGCIVSPCEGCTWHHRKWPRSPSNLHSQTVFIVLCFVRNFQVINISENVNLPFGHGKQALSFAWIHGQGIRWIEECSLEDVVRARRSNSRRRVLQRKSFEPSMIIYVNLTTPGAFHFSLYLHLFSPCAEGEARVNSLPRDLLLKQTQDQRILSQDDMILRTQPCFVVWAMSHIRFSWKCFFNSESFASYSTKMFKNQKDFNLFVLVGIICRPTISSQTTTQYAEQGCLCVAGFERANGM